MSTLKLFFKKNKVSKSNTAYAATTSLCNENGEPLEWEIKPVTTKEEERIRDQCTYEVPVKGKPNMFRTTLNTTKYLSKLLTASVVFPDLLNAELQDSYGVNTDEDLLKELIDNPKEFGAFAAFVQDFNGLIAPQENKAEQVKN